MCKKLIFLSIFVSLCSMLTMNSWATVNNCLEDVSGNLNCVAGDTKLNSFTVLSGPSNCVAGEDISVTLQASMKSTATGRYDIGTWVALDGGNALTGVCDHNFLSPIAPNSPSCDAVADPPAVGTGVGPYANVECSVDANDKCGDLIKDQVNLLTLPPVTLKCQDNDNDGVADVSACISWDENNNITCVTADDAVPGAPSKCSCGITPIAGITVTECGNGVVEEDEDCDLGADNGVSETCCDATCHFKSSGTTCRAADGVCDTAEICTGSNPFCPTDAKKADGTTCSDGNACTTGDTCQSGSCTSGQAVVCGTPDQCHTTGTCDPQTGQCSNPTKADGTTCSDGNACTQTDTCQVGSCVGVNPVTCNALDQCHTPGACNPESGICSNPTKTDGSACSDGNACSSNDVCTSGSCTSGAPVSCPTPDQCHTAVSCDVATGSCPVLPAKPNGTPCNDGNPATGVDECFNGTCTGGFLPAACTPICGAATCPTPTIIGTSSGQVIHGTIGDDSIDGKGGSDTIQADEGSDCVLAESGVYVQIVGEKGDDKIIYQGGGQGIIDAGEGNDCVFITGPTSGSNPTRIDGSMGCDVIHAESSGAKLIYGGSEPDVIYGSPSNDKIYGGEGNDVIYGGGGNDYLDGGDGVDSCDGGPGIDTCVHCEVTTNCEIIK